jgi:hypothetical protein
MSPDFPGVAVLLDPVQVDLFENITDVPIDYFVARGGFWRMGMGVKIDRKKGSKPKAVVRTSLGKIIRVPLDLVRRHDTKQMPGQ